MLDQDAGMQEMSVEFRKKGEIYVDQRETTGTI